MAYVSRDPFARQEMHREREYVVSRACDWCGGVRRTRNNRHYLFCYRIESDGGRKSDVRGMFCSKSCMESFHG